MKKQTKGRDSTAKLHGEDFQVFLKQEKKIIGQAIMMQRQLFSLDVMTQLVSGIVSYRLQLHVVSNLNISLKGPIPSILVVLFTLSIKCL